ncbi:MAG: bifunctional 4-hydroxy-2-oxoglutarate aldolase/2-dehydro-3-deoxy-phosphogluconate aldolase [Bacteroidales bacterium]|nr:bifunctional 4-hydroxy-2-oxoglutarate aldolase/2-dehydro-3-deoxy-phosphogluconate aldolase [Bacteroidales bacterium]
MFKNNEVPILSILRGIDRNALELLAEIFIKTGIRYTEITMNTKNAPDLIKTMKGIAGNEFVVGAGTVLSVEDIDKAMEAGASFIVCPSVIEDVIDKCCKNNIPVFPGALTPTEVHRAWDMGATMVKLFPATAFGPSYIKALKAPFNEIKIMAVGGINDETISTFFANGADAVAVGASIFRLEWIEDKRFSLIEDKLTSLIRRYRQEDIA